MTIQFLFESKSIIPGVSGLGVLGCLRLFLGQGFDHRIIHGLGSRRAGHVIGIVLTQLHTFAFLSLLGGLLFLEFQFPPASAASQSSPWHKAIWEGGRAHSMCPTWLWYCQHSP